MAENIICVNQLYCQFWIQKSSEGVKESFWIFVKLWYFLLLEIAGSESRNYYRVEGAGLEREIARGIR